MDELKDWNEVTKGLYRYVIAANVCYEIHILNWYHNTDILTAMSSLYIVGDWHTNAETLSGRKESFFRRECLMSEQPVFECIKKAVEDNKENNN